MKAIVLLFMLTISALTHSNPPESVKNILLSGNGKSFGTAYEIRSIEEEYQVLEYLKLNPRIQMLMLFEGQYYDVLHVDDTQQVYFKIPSN